MIVAVDPGHGGRDPGAVGLVQEVEVNYPWARSLVAELIASGVDARLTHEEPRPGKKVTIDQRYRSANAMRADLFISVHANAFNGRASGAEVDILPYMTGSGDRADIAASMAFRILPEIIREMGRHGEGIVRRRDLGVLNHTEMPAVLLELGFVDNPEDAGLLMSYAYLRESAQRVAHVIAAAGPVTLRDTMLHEPDASGLWKSAGDAMRSAWKSIAGRRRS